MIPGTPKTWSATIFSFVLLLAITQSTFARHLQHGEAQDSSIRTIKDAGLQFEMPKGWNVETQENGNVVLSVDDGAASVTFVVEDKYDEVVAGMKSGLKD